MSSDEEEGADALQRQPPPEDPNASLPSLFWDALPQNHEEHPDWLAMQAIAEECPPEERAENFKVQGNKKLKAGLEAQSRNLMREAAEFYAKGLALQCADAKVNAALHNNTAHVHILLGNWRKALQHASSALQLQPDSVKACYRGAKAAMRLRDYTAASAMVRRGLEVEPDAQELLQLQRECDLAVQRAEQETRQDAQQRAEARAPAERLAAAICARGVRMTQPQVSVGVRRPHLDEQGRVHWPVLFVFAETMQQDVVEDMHEDDTLSDHLDVMFGEGAPPLEWDERREYSREAIELFYLPHAGRAVTQEQLATFLHGDWPESLGADAGPSRYGDKAASWRQVDEKKTLGEVLAQDGHLVPGVPLFWVVAKGTPYRQRFLAQELQR